MASSSRAGANRPKRSRRSDDQPRPRLVRIIHYANQVNPQPPARNAAPVRYRNVTDHPLLRFHERTGAYIDLQRIAPLELFQHRTVDWNLLRILGAEEEFRNLAGPKWVEVFACDQPQYRELTIEFLSTLYVRKNGFDEHDAVSFALGGEVHEMTLPQFAVATGFYTPEEANSTAFARLARGLATKREHVGPFMSQLEDFWGEIAEGECTTRITESSIREPIVRYLHHVLAGTLFGRANGRDKVSTPELVVLHSIMRGGGGNIASFLLASAKRGHREGGQLALGPYITGIAANLGVLNVWPAAHLTLGPATRAFTREELDKALIIVDGNPPLWSAHRGVRRQQQGRRVQPPRGRMPRTAAPPPPFDMTMLRDQLFAYHDEHYRRQEEITRYWMNYEGVPIPDWYQGPGGYAEPGGGDAGYADLGLGGDGGRGDDDDDEEEWQESEEEEEEDDDSP